jgi:predicted small secreted protein
MKKTTLFLVVLLLAGIFLFSGCYHNYWKGRGVKPKTAKTAPKYK